MPENDKIRGRRLTSAESELVARQDLYEFDEDILKEIADYFTGPYRRETYVVCDGCGKLVPTIDEMPAGCTRIGILHGYCQDCIRKIMERNKESKND